MIYNKYQFKVNQKLKIEYISKIDITENETEESSWEILAKYAEIDSSKYSSLEDMISDETAQNKLLSNEKAIDYIINSNNEVQNEIKQNIDMINKLLSSNYASKFIINLNWYNVIKSNPEINLDTYSKTNPIPTSVNDARIINSGYNQVSNEPGYNCLDKNQNTFWTSDLTQTLPAYMGWNFESNVVVYKLAIQNRYNYIDTAIKDFTIQGYNSNTGVWEDIQNYTNTNYEKGAITQYYINEPKSYLKYQLKITSEGARDDQYVQIAELKYYYY